MAIIFQSYSKILSFPTVPVIFTTVLLLYASIASLALSAGANDRLEHRTLLPDAAIGHQTPHIAGITADCASPDRIFISLKLDQPFKGIVYAKGHYGTPECMFVNQQPTAEEANASSSFNFTAPVAACGRNFADKKRNLKISSVTLMIQQDPLFIDKTDYAREIRCTWTLRFDQVISLKPFVVSEAQKPPDRNEFRGDELSIMMDVKLGRNPFSGSSLGNEPVALGTEMTIVVLVKSDTVDPHTIDVVVRDCQARDVDSGAIVPLTNANGCVLQPKLITPFRITLDVPLAGVALAAYSALQSFKFPDTPRVRAQLQTRVWTCRTSSTLWGHVIISKSGVRIAANFCCLSLPIWQTQHFTLSLSINSHSLTCNVALCKGSCGIECPATTHANNASSKTDNGPSIQPQQINAVVSHDWTASKRSNVQKQQRTRRATAQQHYVPAEAPPRLSGNESPIVITAPSRRSRQLLGKTVSTPFDESNTNRNLSIDDVFRFLHDPHFLDMALMRAKRIILDAKTRLHQVQVGQDIMVVADTKANSVAAGENLPIIIDDPLAARNGANAHLEEAADVKLARISGGGNTGEPSTEVTQLKCVDHSDMTANHWIIIVFLFVFLLLLLSIIIVLAMFISHYRAEAREAQQKYKLYDSGGGGRSEGRGGRSTGGDGRCTSTPATYYVASTSPTYQLYSTAEGEMHSSAYKTRATPNKPSRVPSLPPPLSPSCLLAHDAQSHKHQQQTFNTWTTHDHPVDIALQLHSGDIGQTPFSCGDVSVASRSLCRSLPSLAGAFHDQQLSLIPILSESGGGDQPQQFSIMSILSAPGIERMESMNSNATGPQLLSINYNDELVQLHSMPPLLPLPPSTNSMFENMVQHTPARDDSRSMISNVTSNGVEHSRLGSVSTFRPANG